jgi:hypothetical protein
MALSWELPAEDEIATTDFSGHSICVLTYCVLRGKNISSGSCVYKVQMINWSCVYKSTSSSTGSVSQLLGWVGWVGWWVGWVGLGWVGLGWLGWLEPDGASYIYPRSFPKIHMLYLCSLAL